MRAGGVIALLVPALAHGEPSRSELAVRIELAQVSTSTNDLGDASGSGPAIDVELATRRGRWSLAAFGVAAYESISGLNDAMSGGAVPFSFSEQTIDLGVRGRVHAGPVWFGAGVGLEELRYDGNPFNTAVSWEAQKVIELHAGATLLPLADGVLLDVFASYTIFPDVGAFNSRSLTRIGLGVRL